MYRLVVHSIQLFSITAIWAHVIEQPLDNKIIVFNRGTSKGLMGIIPAGGQMFPNSRVG